MSNRRKINKPVNAGSGKLYAVGSPTMAAGKRVSKRAVPAVPRAAATSVHVVRVSLEGADPPVWRRLEVPSAIRLDRLHEVLQEVFNWNDWHLHLFDTSCGEFGPPSEPELWSSRERPEAGVTLAQVASEEGAVITYVYDFGDDWRHDILVEKIMPAAPGVAYPRCTGGQGEETPGDDSGGIWAFNAERAEIAAEDGPPVFPWTNDIEPELETEALKHLATVIIPASGRQEDR
jgi:Plasmid pRiA4b ORF-3-like protein